MKKRLEVKSNSFMPQKFKKKPIGFDDKNQEIYKDDKFIQISPRSQTYQNLSSYASHKIIRHASQQEIPFKKDKKRNNFIQKEERQWSLRQEDQVQDNEDQFQLNNFEDYKNVQIKKQQKKQQKINKISNFEKKSVTSIQKISKEQHNGLSHLVLPTNLKDTTSTASNDLSLKYDGKKSLLKDIPSFVKKKNQAKKQNQQYEKHQTKLRDSFKIIKKLGQGKFGKVFLVKEIYTNMVLAMKIVEKKQIIQNNLLNQFIRELKIHSYLDHPNIIKLHGFFHDRYNFYVIMECGCDGQLFQLMTQNQNKKSFSQATASFLARNLLIAINYMHSKNILHRDLKPENIVMINGFPKLCDFGWTCNIKSRQLPLNQQNIKELRQTFCGTPLYLSPQLLQGQKYDQKVDLWAIGVLIYQLMFNSSPFGIQTQEDLYNIITSQVNFPSISNQISKSNKTISSQMKQFIQMALKKDPKQRVSAQKLLQTKFITMYQDIDTCEELCL